MLFYRFGKAKWIPCLGFSGSQRTVSHNITNAMSTETHKVPSSSQKYLKPIQVKQHWRICLLSHTSTCCESCTHTYSTLSFPACFSSSHFCILLLSSILKSSPGDQRPLTLQRHQRSTHTYCMRTQSVCLHEECVRERLSEKRTKALYPKKLGQRGLSFEGGRWCYGFDVGGWVG